MKYGKLSKEELKAYVILLIASLFYVLPIILADRYYNDDLARALYGATGWKGDGRPLGEYIVLTLCEGYPVIDIAPFPIILSILILGYSLILYARTNLGFMSNLQQVIVFLLIIVNPFAIANLSYQFDCIIMITALSLNFFIYALPEKVNTHMLFFLSIIAGVLIMSSYQATIGMSLVLFLLNLYFILIGERKKQSEFVRVIGIILGAVIYKLFIASHFVALDDWRMEASQLVSDFSMSSIQVIFANIERTCEYILHYFFSRSVGYQVLWISIILSSIIMSVTYCYKQTRYIGVKKVIYLSLVGIYPLLVFVVTFLPLMVLNKLSIKSRIFIAFGGFLFFIGIILFKFIKKEKVVFVLLAICIFYQYTYIYAYGNAMASQNEYEKYMAYNIVHDIECVNYDESYKEISFIGNMPKSKQLQMMCEKYPFFEEIVPVYFGNSTWIGGTWVYYYMQDSLDLVASTETDEEVCNISQPVVDNNIYSCYLNNQKIIIRFKEL